MLLTMETLVDRYGKLAVRVALNLQPGQRLLIIGPLANGGVSLEAAPLVRAVAAQAYAAGASYVEALWGDEALQLARFRHAPADSFDLGSDWLGGALAAHAEAGHAVLSISCNDPDLLHGQPMDRLGAVQKAVARDMRRFRDQLGKNRMNWAVIAAPSDAWAARVFPTLGTGAAKAALWDAIASLVRLNQPNPVAAWEAHLAALAARRDFLNARRYAALRYSGPGTDLTVGLAEAHEWVSGRSVSAAGFPFAPNLPTEEVFTMPDAGRVDGVVTATKPLSHGGTLIDGFSLRFEGGRVVSASAREGEGMLQQLLATDPGASRLGEVALVPHSSPVAQSGLLFYNTLFDENAASHLALGSAYRFTRTGGESMTDEAFEAAGGNRSTTHVDFMIGSAALDIDGVDAAGRAEPLMRAGEWTTAL